MVRLSFACWLDDGKKVSNERLPNLDAKTLRGKSLDTFLLFGKLVEEKQKVILVDGENSGEVFVVPFRGYLGSTFKVLGISPILNIEYVNSILNYYKDLFRGNKIGAAIPHLNKKIFKSLLVGIPPLEEQARIVAAIEKYEPLIAEYEKLEQQATKLDDEIYDKLKKSILQYAIQGKLVPQDESDEPASVLLERIRAEKKAQLGKKYVDSYIYKGDDNCYYEKIGNKVENITEETANFDLPDGWSLARLRMYSVLIFSGKSPKYSKQPSAHKIIGQQANQWTGLNLSYIKYATDDFAKEMPEIYYLQDGDILLNTLGNGTLGRSGYFDSSLCNDKILTDGHIFVFRNLNKVMSLYLLIYLKVKFDEIIRSANGSTNQTFLNLGKTLQWLIPVPPLQEQERIVEATEIIIAKL